MKKNYYLGIDVGILNLGIAFVRLDDDESIHVEHVERINLTHVRHSRVSIQECKILHTNMLCDRVNHFIQEYYHLFEKSNLIFIEQQPILGITSVEQLLLDKFRDKTTLISPVKMHKYFGIHKLKDYELRKEKTIEYADSILKDNFIQYTREKRKHDIADALCIVTYGCNEIIRKNKMVANNDFEKFKFVPRV